MFTVSLRTRARAAALAAATALLMTGLSAPPAGAAEGDTLRDKLAEQQRLREEQAAAAAKLDVLKANDRQVSAAIDALDASVRGQQSQLVQAQRREQEANAALVAAQQAEAAQVARLAAVQDEAQRFALQAYISPANELSAVLEAADGAATYRAGLAALQASRFTDSLDELDAVEADLTAARASAERAATRAEQRRADSAGYLQQLQSALGRQQSAEERIEDRLDAALTEAAVLDQLDAKLAGEIRQEQAAIASRLQAARLAAQAAAARSGISLPTPGSGRSVGSPVGSISVTMVGGITVNVSIAGQIAALLRDAASSGINLGGGGYRSADAQIAVRRSNCGPSQYDIWQKPSGQCRPPAARPGQSMHEQGLAIDFTCNGALITSRSNACYRWLAANAGRYGLMGNSREAWHWSTNGH